MRLEQLEYFIAVAKQGSISSAAKSLHISRQAVSSAIAALEEELGFPLLLKKYYGVETTLRGMRILEKAVKAMQLINEIRDDGKQNFSGTFTVCATPLISLLFTSRMFMPFKKIYPYIDVVFLNAFTYSMIDFLVEGKTNIAITRNCIDIDIIEMANHLGFEYVKLYDDEYRIFLSNNHPLATKEKLCVDDLSNLRIAIYSNDQDIILKKYASYFQGVYRVANRTDMIALTLSGESILVQPYYLFSHDNRVINGSLIAKQIPLQEIDLSFTIIAINNKKMKTEEEQFWDFMIKNFTKYLCDLHPSLKNVTDV